MVGGRCLEGYWGRIFQQRCEGASRGNRIELVKIRRLVGVYSAPDRDPRIHSICILVEAEVDGKMKVQDTLEVIEIEAFPHISAPGNFPMTTISSYKTILMV